MIDEEQQDQLIATIKDVLNNELLGYAWGKDYEQGSIRYTLSGIQKLQTILEIFRKERITDNGVTYYEYILTLGNNRLDCLLKRSVLWEFFDGAEANYTRQETKRVKNYYDAWMAMVAGERRKDEE